MDSAKGAPTLGKGQIASFSGFSWGRTPIQRPGCIRPGIRLPELGSRGLLWA